MKMKLSSLVVILATAACSGKIDEVGEVNEPESTTETESEPDSTPVETPEDADGDGFDLKSDCDDNDSQINPDAEEICDGMDNDCDGSIDEGLLTLWYADFDGDGYGDDEIVQEACSPPKEHLEEGGDCDPTDGTIYPGAPEVCDIYDSDCDGSLTDGETDLDGDGVPDCIDSDGDGDGVEAIEDCDDTDPTMPTSDADCDGVAIGDDYDDSNPNIGMGYGAVASGESHGCALSAQLW